jgi:hypothetical protein
MDEIKFKGRPLWMTHYGEEGPGDVFTDRFNFEWPRMRGREVSEEEYQQWLRDNPQAVQP